MSVSGLTSTRLKRFQAEANEADMPVFAYAGSRRTAPAATAALTRPQAGGNFAAALSYGDLTAAAFGTTTAICGDQALAFGHPFQYIGAATYGANDANSLAIVKDPTFGSFKLASVGAQFGTVDQDRLAGLRADLTRVPTLTPIRSTIRNLDNGKRRRGTTLAADRDLTGRDHRLRAAGELRRRLRRDRRRPGQHELDHHRQAGRQRAVHASTGPTRSPPSSTSQPTRRSTSAMRWMRS